PPPPQVPALKGSPKASAQRELSASGLTLLPKRARDSKTFSSFVAKLGYRESTLYLSVEVSDPSVTSGDILKVSLFFPLSGTTARPYTYRFGADGKRSPDPDTGAPFVANQRVDSSVQRLPDGWSMLAAFPAQALPRFPATRPLLLEVCVSYEDHSDVAGAAETITNCDLGQHSPAPMRL